MWLGARVLKRMDFDSLEGVGCWICCDFGARTGGGRNHTRRREKRRRGEEEAGTRKEKMVVAGLR